jgi:hypothetical protein
LKGIWLKSMKRNKLCLVLKLISLKNGESCTCYVEDEYKGSFLC